MRQTPLCNVLSLVLVLQHRSAMCVVLLCVACIAGCGGQSTPPVNTLQQAVAETVAMNDAALRTTGPQVTTILQSDPRGEWAYVIVADGPEPKHYVGRGTYVVADEDEGRMWKLHSGRVFRVEGKQLTWAQDQHGGNRAHQKSDKDPLPDSVKKEWEKKWLDYVKANGYTVTDKK